MDIIFNNHQLNSDDRHRKHIINKVIVNTLLEEYTEEEALGIFLWKLTDIEPPINHRELLLFRALYRTFRAYCNTTISNTADALKFFNIPAEKLGLSSSQIIKEIKISYWNYINDNTCNINKFLQNAHNIGARKKAFYYLCQNIR